MSFRSFFLFVLVGFFLHWGAHLVHGQNRRADRPPRLVVGLVVGSLTSDQLRSQWESLSPDGFNRLSERGVRCDEVTSPCLTSSAVTGCANLVSGAGSSVHGVVGEWWYDRLTGSRVSLVGDDRYRAVGANGRGERVSPHRVAVATLSEVWRDAYPTSRIYSLSLEAPTSVVLGGRGATAALWLDWSTGQLVTSSYYVSSEPEWLSSFNALGLAREYSQREWNPAGSGSGGGVLTRVPSDSDGSARRLPGGTVHQLLARPQGNSYLRDALTYLVVHDSLGQRVECDGAPDLVSVYFSAMAGVQALYGPESVHATDALRRFDRELASLIDFLDGVVGSGQYLLVVTSGYASERSPSWYTRWDLPGGHFSMDRAFNLLNAYLKASYGKEDCLLGFGDGTIYLNELAFDGSGVTLSEAELVSAQFLEQMSGVGAVHVSSGIRGGRIGGAVGDRLVSGYHRKRSGHLVVELEPGWVFRTPLSALAENSTLSQAPGSLFLYFYGWKLRRGRVSDPPCSVDILPTLCGLLQIAGPGTMRGTPIGTIVNWE